MSRRDIYYWKCDRPAAFYGTRERLQPDDRLHDLLQQELRRYFASDSLQLSVAAGQGNHLTWNADCEGRSLFIRVENGPEADNYLEVETAVLREVANSGVPVPRVHGCDTSRFRVPFAWQALERLPYPDLNHWHKLGTMDAFLIAFEIGRSVAQWQSITPIGFGPFDLDCLGDANEPTLTGLHADYASYFFLRLTQHLDYLVAHSFLSSSQRREISETIEAHRSLLSLHRGCLVHKDLALWNILGGADHIAAFIDFDDAISGDPMDDLSLLACFHDSAFLDRALAGYRSVRPLPNNDLRRFWLHLLRNMIVKAVIRVGSGYFERDPSFFLIAPGASGASLRQQTEQRLQTALRGLQTEAELSIL